MGNKKVVTVTQAEFHEDPGGVLKDAGDADVCIVDEEGNRRAYMGTVRTTRWDTIPFTRDEYVRLRNELQNDPKVKYASFSAIAMEHPAYKDIVDAGEDALGFIFEDLRDNDSLYTIWTFPAITEILGEDAPTIPEELMGKVDQRIEIYLEWAEENGYL